MGLNGYCMGRWIETPGGVLNCLHRRQSMDDIGSGSGQDEEGREDSGLHNADSHLGRVVQGCAAEGTRQEVGQDRQEEIVAGRFVRHNFKHLGQKVGYG